MQPPCSTLRGQLSCAHTKFSIATNPRESKASPYGSGTFRYSSSMNTAMRYRRPSSARPSINCTLPSTSAKIKVRRQFHALSPLGACILAPKHRLTGKLSHIAFTRPPFKIEEKGWGEFDMEIVLSAVDKGGEFPIPHDLNFQSTRYESKHQIVSLAAR